MITECRKHRAKQTAEVFTPDRLVNQMLNKLPKEVWRKNKTFCDPACGNGQFIIWVLLRKIQRGHKILDALKTVYGVDIMQNNIRECRLRLLKVVSIWEDVTEDHIKAVFQNIVWVNQKTNPSGSLEYDFSFKNKAKQANVDRWMNCIHDENMLDTVDLPVDPEKFLSTGQVDIFFEL